MIFMQRSNQRFEKPQTGLIHKLRHSYDFLGKLLSQENTFLDQYGDTETFLKTRPFA